MQCHARNSYIDLVFEAVSRVKIEAISAESHDKSIVVEQSISPGEYNCLLCGQIHNFSF